MAEPIKLNILDTPMLDQTNFGPDMDRWLSNSVDSLNSTSTIFLLGVGQKDIGGGGAGPITVPLVGLMSNNFVNVNLISSSNPVSITDVTAGTDQFFITFNADPGASAIIVYQAFTGQG